MKRILVVDGDTGVRARIAKHARMEGYDVTEAGDGETAPSLSRQQNAFDLMVLAVNLPGMDGFTVLKAVRTFSAIPVLILSSKNTAEDRIHGLELGADDYMTKPFGIQELVARVRSQLRRYTRLGDVNAAPAGAIVNGRLVYDPDRRALTADGDEVRLTATETGIVDLLMRNLGRVFPAEEIYRRVWGEDAFASDNTVMVHIRRIREKIELNPREPDYLKVVWGIGYKMEKK